VSRQPRLRLRGGLTLRPWAADDAPGLVLAMRDPLVRHYAGALIDDRAEASGAIHRWSSSWQHGDGAAWVVSDPGGQVLGSLRFGLLDPTLGTGSVGYWLHGEVRGQGLAAAAVRIGTEAVFQRLRWRRIELYHAVENARSCGVARRAGFALEGVMREAMRYPVDGRWSDEHLHARLATDPPVPAS
jgi:[ribosomal protein S5]-alanine N-acetyltransferase